MCPSLARVPREVNRFALMLASSDCTRCSGTGALPRGMTCLCVCRRVTRWSLGRWHEFDWGDLRYKHKFGTYCYPRQEYRADLQLAAHRALDEGGLYRLFELYHLRSRDLRECTAALGISRGEFFHAVYRAEYWLGRELLRSGLYPVRRYLQN
ncbi:MAG: hypothetical protein M3N54_12830 [Acidobacteriota bacterium]|nr:hypothetical protein [Acidobacteriota bacterium]